MVNTLSGWWKRQSLTMITAAVIACPPGDPPVVIDLVGDEPTPGGILKWGPAAAQTRIAVVRPFGPIDFGGFTFTNEPTMYDSVIDLNWDSETWKAAYLIETMTIESFDEDGNLLGEPVA
jgi:hypothetical protein